MSSAPIQVVHNAYTPKEGLEIASRAGSYKANMRIDKIIISSFMAGALLSFAGACFVTINTSDWYATNAPGLIKMYGALIFPFGLVVIVLTGADLATGSFMVCWIDSISCLNRMPIMYSTPLSPLSTVALPSSRCCSIGF